MGIFPETYNEPKSLPYRPFTSARGRAGGGGSHIKPLRKTNVVVAQA